MTQQEILDMFKIKIERIGQTFNYDDYKDNLDGSHEKSFVRISKKDFEELISPKSKKDKFITYIDNIRKDGLAPENISVLLKTMWGATSVINETLASRIMNYFDCSTVYNVPYYALDKKKKRIYYVASTDCISENETFENLYRYVSVLDDRAYTVWRKVAKKMEEEFQDNPHLKEDVEKMEEEFFRSQIVREFVLRDYDIGTHNFGVLYNEKEKRFR